jgi:hypothetical protein
MRRKMPAITGTTNVWDIMARAEIEYRRVVALRLFDALCARYPDKYVALTIPPRDVADDPDEMGEVMVRWPVFDGERLPA